MFPRNQNITALGQVEAPYILDKLPECAGVPIGYLPVVRNLVLEYGCSAGGQAAAATALAQIPKIGPFISLVGTPALVRCACAYQAAVHPPPSQQSFDSTSWVLVALAIGVVVLLAKK